MTYNTVSSGTLNSTIPYHTGRVCGCCVVGMFAIRAERDYVIEEDFLKAVRKIADNKKLETKLDYKPV